MTLQNRVALITGSASGIGRATALRFAQQGAGIVACDLDSDRLASLVKEITEAGGQAVATVGNVALAADCRKIVQIAQSSYQRLDILVNNAGITRDAVSVSVKNGEIKRMTEEQWEEVISVNLKGTFLCCQQAVPLMVEGKYGRIINTSSVGALGNFGQANYAASKAGVIGLTRTLALELARYGITVNAVAPGAVKTPMTASMPEQVLEGMKSRIPLRRLAEADEIAGVHLFLAGEDSGYITGQVIWVDGGLSLGV